MHRWNFSDLFCNWLYQNKIPRHWDNGSIQESKFFPRDDCRLAKNNWFCNIFFYKITKGCPIKGQFHLLVESNKLFNSWVVELKAWNIWFNCSRHKMAHNDHGLLPWRTSNLVNVRRPSGVTYFKRREAAQSHGSKPMLHAVILSKMPLVR